MSVDYVMHFGICVRDLERSIRFYRDGLGFVEKGKLHIEDAPTAQMMGIPDLVLDAVYLERDGVRIELLAYPQTGTVGPATARPMNQPGLTHFAVRVDDRDSDDREADGPRWRRSSRRVGSRTPISRRASATSPIPTGPASSSWRFRRTRRARREARWPA